MKNKLPMEAAIARYAREEGVSLKDLFSRNRERAVSWPRQNVMRRLSQERGLSSTRIGQILGRDHSTVLHGIRASEARAKQKRARNEQY